MKITKYCLVSIVLISLCIVLVFAKTQPDNGTQWEYACYKIIVNNTSPKLNMCVWLTPTVVFTGGGNPMELWQRAGLMPEDETKIVPLQD